ncbi:hypothetical protein FRB99_006416 [Tulasnella sp. 403]|nr:hypothetical protein FRB99_006416 [Tulasnella sp. 403]
MAIRIRRSRFLLFALITAFIFIVNRNRTKPTPKQPGSNLDRRFLGYPDEDDDSGASSEQPFTYPGIMPPGSFPRVVDQRTRWQREGDVPRTTLARHVTGWTVFEGLYAYNGTFYIVTDQPHVVPPIREMISTGGPWSIEMEGQAILEPTDEDMQIISPEMAMEIFGGVANRMPGVSFISNDPPQFMNQYYHFCAEFLLGMWRIYSSLDTRIPPSGDTWLPPPSRLIFPHIGVGEWRDRARMNHVVLRTSFPSISIEHKQDWEDRAKANTAMIFDIAVLTERTAAMRGENFGAHQRVAALTDQLPGNAHWWAPIRTSMLEWAGLERRHSGLIEKAEKPVITYIIRRGIGRALNNLDHRKLVQSLKELEETYGWEVNSLALDSLKNPEAVKLIGRTTILIGVHGKALTSLLWMQPSPSATVIEIFMPNVFSAEYQVPAQMLGIEHYGFWDNRYWRSNSEFKPLLQDQEDEDVVDIPVDGPTLATLCVERIMSPYTLSSDMSPPKENEESQTGEAEAEAAPSDQESEDESAPQEDLVAPQEAFEPIGQVEDQDG